MILFLCGSTDTDTINVRVDIYLFYGPGACISLVRRLSHVLDLVGEVHLTRQLSMSMGCVWKYIYAVIDVALARRLRLVA